MPGQPADKKEQQKNVNDDEDDDGDSDHDHNINDNLLSECQSEEGRGQVSPMEVIEGKMIQRDLEKSLGSESAVSDVGSNLQNGRKCTISVSGESTESDCDKMFAQGCSVQMDEIVAQEQRRGTRCRIILELRLGFKMISRL